MGSKSKVAVFAPASPVEPVRCQRGLQVLRERYQVPAEVVLDPSAGYGGTQYLFSSDTPEHRAKAFQQIVASGQYAALLAARGAYGSVEMLELVRWNDLRGSTIRLCGFSDVTALLAACYHHQVGVAVHAATLDSCFAKLHAQVPPVPDREQLEVSAQQTATALFQDVSLDLSAVQPLGESPQVVTGKIFGGNLITLASLCGTPWFPQLQDHLLFIEEVGESPYRIHRALMQILSTPQARGLVGIVAGYLTRCEHPKQLGPDVHQVLRAISERFKVPVWVGLKAGHEALNLPVTLGQVLTLRN